MPARLGSPSKPAAAGELKTLPVVLNGTKKLANVERALTAFSSLL